MMMNKQSVTADIVGQPTIQQYFPTDSKFQPKFFFHWGETSVQDAQVFYLSICNPFQEVLFKGMRIEKVTLRSQNTGIQINIQPKREICLDQLKPCACLTREFALVQGNHPKGVYHLDVQYTFDEATFTKQLAKQKTRLLVKL